MKTQKLVRVASKGLILLSALSLLSVSLMAFSDPQSVMDLVQVKLSNPDAFSSIRGVYGGVGLTLFISLAYLMLRDTRKGLAFLCLLWGFYALSRTITIYVEGSLGDFGNQWLVTESVLFVLALVLAILYPKPASPQEAFQHESHKPGTAAGTFGAARGAAHTAGELERAGALQVKPW